MAATPREAALAAVQQQQQRARMAMGVAHPIGKGDVLAGALQKARERESDSSVHGDTVHSWHFRYPRHTEELRWARTRDIISRVAPGSDEDASYLEMLARQAASVEMILRGEHTSAPNAASSELLDRVLIGTVPGLDPGALARRHGDYFFVLVSAGLIEFVYQAARAAVLSWKPVPAEAGAAFSFHNSPADVNEVLDANPLPVMLLQRTLEAYLFRGLPRDVGYAPPPENYQAPLVILTNFNERFVLAHEYGHTLHDALDVVAADGSAAAEEFSADLLAFDLVLRSGDELDRLPPNFSAQGAFFVLTALDILREALDMARHGFVREDRGFVGHPPVAARLARLREEYLQKVSNEDDDLSIEPALSPARTLTELWSRVKRSVLTPAAGETGWTNRPLHEMWAHVR